MKLSTLGILISIIAVAAIAWQLGGSMGVGVMGGGLFGAAVASAAHSWMSHNLQHRPRRAMQSFVEGFMMKFGGLLLGVLAVRNVPQVAERADWRAFLVAYGAMALVVMLLGLTEISRRIKVASALQPLEERGKP